MAHIRQSRPDHGLGFEVDVLTAFQVFPFSLGSGGEAPNPALRLEFGAHG